MSAQFSNATRALFGPFQTAEDVIRDKVTTHERRKAEYNALRHAREVEDREPRVIDSLWLFFGTLAAIGLIEFVGESLTFVSGSDGWLLALLTAVVVTVATQACGGGIGCLWRYTKLRNLKSEPNRRRKNQAWAWPSIIGLSLLAVGFTTTAAYYKEVSTVKDTVNTKDVVAYVHDHPSDLELSSMLLIAIALLSAGLTAWKVASARDPEPGLATAFKRKKVSGEHESAVKNGLRGQVEAVAAVEVEGLPSKARAELGMLTELRRPNGQLALDVDRVQKLDSQDVGAGQAAIKQARALNVRVRADGIFPQAYTTEPDLSELVPGLPITDFEARIEAAIKRQRAKVVSVENDIEVERERVHLIKEHTGVLMLAIAKAPELGKVPELSEVKALIGWAPTPAQITKKTETTDAPV